MVLYIPGLPADHTYVKQYYKYMLLVPETETSRDGSECDKIGVSFHQFKTQAGVCATSKAGDCLHNQLYHKHMSDLELMATQPGSQTKYLLSGQKRFQGAMTFDQDTGDNTLKYQITSISKSIITLNINADKLKVVTTESSAFIVFAQIEPFQSHTMDGTLNVKIRNDGEIKSNYKVTVSECNFNIVKSIPEQARTLEGKEEITLVFDINTVGNLATTNKCKVSLWSQKGKLYDYVWVVFDTFPHMSQYSWELQQKNKESISNKDKFFGFGSCDCAFFDIPCKFIKFCWLDIIILCIIVLAVIALIVGVIIFFLAGGGQYLPAFLCFFCKTFGCCTNAVVCFTKFFARESAKVGKGIMKDLAKPVRKAKRHKRHHRHHHRIHKKKRRVQKKQSTGKKSNKKRSKKKRVVKKSPKFGVTLKKSEVEEFIESGDVVYMNINKTTQLGKEMLQVLKQAMPLPIGDRFCLVGTLRKKKGTYQFIIHEDLLDQTWFMNDDKEWEQCESLEQSKKIKDKYRGYSLQLEHIKGTISKIPFKMHKVINQPLEM
jgi:hypothetical protein